jgi:hypothetical protein
VIVMAVTLSVWATAAAVAGTTATIIATGVSLGKTRRVRSQLDVFDRALEADRSVPTSFDVFLSYAGADRDFAADLARALRERGVSVWWAEDELRPGDSLTGRIADGLSRSRYSLVVLSPAFLARTWPRKELSALTNREADGRSRIIPIWSDVKPKDVRAYSPNLADHVAMDRSRESVDEMAERIAALITHTQ